jgi:hypothetical protein
LLYKSDLSDLGYRGLIPLVFVLALGLFDSMKKVYFVQKKKEKKNKKKTEVSHIPICAKKISIHFIKLRFIFKACDS